MTVTQTLLPVDHDEQLPVYERLSAQAWDVKTQNALQQSLLPQSRPFETWEEYTYQSAPMGRDAHLPPNHDDRPPLVHPVAQPQPPRQQTASSGDLAGSHTPASPHPSSSLFPPPGSSISSSTKPRPSRPPLPSIPDQAPQNQHRSHVTLTPSPDSRFARRVSGPRGARSARRSNSIAIPSVEMTEGKARKEAERYLSQAPAWSSTSRITVEIGPTNVGTSSSPVGSATQPLSVNVPESSQMDPTPSVTSEAYEILSPQEEAPPSFLESGQDRVYSLNEDFSALSIVSEASTMHSQTPSIPEEREEADDQEAEEESDPVQILHSGQRVMESQSAPAQRGSFDTDDLVPSESNPAVMSSDPRQRYSLPVQTSPTSPTSPTPPPPHTTVPPTLPPSQPPPEAAAPITASLPTFRHEGPRILPPPSRFDPRTAFASDEPRSVHVSAFYNSTVGPMMNMGAFKSKPGRDRSGTSVGSVIDRSSLGPMTPRSPSPPHSVRSAGLGGPGSGGTMQQSPTSIGSNSHMYGDTGFFGSGGSGGMPNPGSFPNSQLYPAPPSFLPPHHAAPSTTGLSGQSRILVPLAPGYVPGPGQLAGVDHPAMNAGRGMSPPNDGGVGGNTVQGQFGQRSKRFSALTNMNVHGVGMGTNPWG